MHTPARASLFWLLSGFAPFALAQTPPAPAAEIPVQLAVGNGVEKSSYGTLPDGAGVELYTLKNKNGALAKIITYGATITELDMPDRTGKLANVVLGADSLAAYQRFAQPASVMGRVANRIAGAKFTLDGKDYTLNANDGPNTLHGGRIGFSKVVWQGDAASHGKDSDPAVKLTYVSKDGEEGFPGTLTVSVTYTLTADNTLRLEYSATTDKPTPVNLTNHAFFNLSGTRSDSSSHVLMINAGHYTEADAALIPTGEIKSVKGTPYDFTAPIPLGTHAAELPGRHYDNSFVLNRDQDSAGKLTLAARVTEPISGRIMEVWTDQPGLQLYTSTLTPPPAPALAAAPANATASGSASDSAASGAPARGGRGRGAGRGGPGFLVLETQHLPDAVHHANFPSIILRPGETFSSKTEYRFSAK